MSTDIKQPKWHAPQPTYTAPSLRLNNSLTRQKEVFITQTGTKQLTWYNCGPTVYDAAHMGHARNYITFDIVRRILEDYFNYEILYIMNITDIDDKIILRARQNYLIEKFKLERTSLDNDVIKILVEAWKEFVQSKFLKAKTLENTGISVHKAFDDFDAFALLVTELETKLKEDIGEKFSLYWNTILQMKAALDHAAKEIKKDNVDTKECLDELFEASLDALADYLDKRMFTEVNDKSIFQKLASHWENEFFVDMQRLNVRPPDVLTRVSEYVPEIVEYVKTLVDKGLAYESNGSVYFDLNAFKMNNDYAKLAPWAAGHSRLVAEGEGSLGAALTGKKSDLDFALWKAAKPGEPTWESPWGLGRPGWHIECSVMANEVATSQVLDIHSGGIDLCFPHHDNEMAQAEAYYGSQQWVNYFLHSGHLHIEGQKMSKSLKNFITIKEALNKYSGTQIRYMFLLHSWDSLLDYKESSMQSAAACETKIRNFLEYIKALGRSKPAQLFDEKGVPRHSYYQPEKDLMKALIDKQTKVHEALSDNLNTPQAMAEILDLISTANVYIRSLEVKKVAPNLSILQKIGKYVTRMMKTFGVYDSGNDQIGGSSDSQDSSAGENLEDKLIPYLSLMAEFRGEVRRLAKSGSEKSDLLKLCDKLRDVDLPNLGVLLEDKEDDKSLIKLVPAEELKRMSLEKEKKEQEKAAAREAQAKQERERRLEKLKRGETKPENLFKTDEFSKWDDNGLPTHDKEGVELAKSRRKKLQKEYDTQVKLHKEYTTAKEKGEIN